MLKYATFLAICIFTILGFGCQPVTEETPDQASLNLNLASLYFTQVYNEDNLALINEIFIEDYIHENTEGKIKEGRDQLMEAITNIKRMLPNLKLTVLEGTADDEKAIFLVNMSSDLPSFALETARTEKVNLNEVFIFWIKDNKIYKGRTIGTHLELLKQITGFEGGLMESFNVFEEHMKKDLE